MGQSAVKNPRKIFSQAGADPALNNRVTNLENNEYFKSTVTFEKKYNALKRKVEIVRSNK